MDFFELIQKRQSCRAYNGQAVGREKLERVVDAARMAPSACNSQPWHFIVVDEPEKVQKTAKLLQDKVVPINRFTDSCPAFVVVCEGKTKLSEKVSGRFKGQEFAQIDTGIAAAHLCFAATELGLGCCILGWSTKKASRICCMCRSLRGSAWWWRSVIRKKGIRSGRRPVKKWMK